MIGKIIAFAVFILSLVATYIYFVSYKKQDNPEVNSQKMLDKAGILYWAISFGVIFISVFLLSLIIDHNFSYTYIYNYSSLELPTSLLVSSFWAGQEGSFLLWALFFVIIGLFVRPYAKKHGYEALVMGFYSLILTFLMLLIILKSPFDNIMETFKDQALQPGFMPQNGRGMNPILQNYWMAIHPPILFIGYALMSVPFVFAVSGLIKRDFTGWIKVATPWTLLATAILGLGIMLGGFWAYETLGWGGFWGWDPVENSSLIPWILAVALVHTIIVQRKTGALLKTNFILSILGFIFIIYATFLTRSGVLSETSVHSFTKPGNLVYAILVAFQVSFVLIGAIVLIIRFKDLPKREGGMKLSSREAFLTIGSIVMLASAVIIFFGTSFPLISAIMGTKQASPQIKFYNDSNLPIAILILLTNALSLFMNWRETSWSVLFKKVMLAFGLALVLSIGTIFLGVKNIAYFLLVFGAFFTLIINLELTIRNLMRNPKGIGAYISHFGFAILIFGIIGSGIFSESQNIHLAKNETKSAFGYNFTFTGTKQIEKEFKDREKYQYLIKTEKNGNIDYIKPIIYMSDFNERQEPIFEPGIQTYWLRDIYLSPKGVERTNSGPILKLRKTESGNCPIDTNMKIEFTGFDMTHAQQEDNQGVTLGALVNITYNGNVFEDTLITKLDMRTSEFSPIMREIKGTGIYGGFAHLIKSSENMAMSQALFVFSKTAQQPEQTVSEVFIFEASVKPLISLVWLGVILVVGGFFFAIVKSMKKVVVVENIETEKIEIPNE